jgi:hypothetical protein
MRTTKETMNNVGRSNRPEDDYNWPILCCIFSFTVWYALIIVCSLMTISVVSGRGLLTREAIAAASVSTIILEKMWEVSNYHAAERIDGKERGFTRHQWSHLNTVAPGRGSPEPLSSLMNSAGA